MINLEYSQEMAGHKWSKWAIVSLMIAIFSGPISLFLGYIAFISAAGHKEITRLSIGLGTALLTEVLAGILCVIILIRVGRKHEMRGSFLSLLGLVVVSIWVIVIFYYVISSYAEFD